MATIREVCTDALKELFQAPGESVNETDLTFALGKLNRLLDNWNAERAAVYAQQFNTYDLVADLAPHTIGPGGTFEATQRPVSIEGANLILSSTPNPYLPINVRGPAWWDAQTVPDLTGSIPTDVYYQPDFPLGKLYFWPVPTETYSVELQTRVVLAEVTLDDEFELPPGYRDAITLTVAEECSEAFAKPVGARLAQSAMQARARIFRNNDLPPNLRTWDSGMPTAGQRADFNYRNGQFFGS